MFAEIFVSMANDKDSNSITSKCSVCGHVFPNIQDCLKHELLSHHLKKKTKKLNQLQKKIKVTENYLNSPEKLEERTQLREKFKTTPKGEELKTIFELSCIRRDYLGLIYTRIQTSLEKLFAPSGVAKIYPFGSIVSGLALRGMKISSFLLFFLYKFFNTPKSIL